MAGSNPAGCWAFYSILQVVCPKFRNATLLIFLFKSILGHAAWGAASFISTDRAKRLFRVLKVLFWAQWSKNQPDCWREQWLARRPRRWCPHDAAWDGQDDVAKSPDPETNVQKFQIGLLFSLCKNVPGTGLAMLLSSSTNLYHQLQSLWYNLRGQLCRNSCRKR